MEMRAGRATRCAFKAQWLPNDHIRAISCRECLEMSI